MSEYPADTFTATVRHRWRKATVFEALHQPVAQMLDERFDIMTGHFILEQAWINQQTGEVQWRAVEVSND